MSDESLASDDTPTYDVSTFEPPPRPGSPEVFSELSGEEDEEEEEDELDELDDDESIGGLDVFTNPEKVRGDKDSVTSTNGPVQESSDSEPEPVKKRNKPSKKRHREPSPSPPPKHKHAKFQSSSSTHDPAAIKRSKLLKESQDEEISIKKARLVEEILKKDRDSTFGAMKNTIEELYAEAHRLNKHPDNGWALTLCRGLSIACFAGLEKGSMVVSGKEDHLLKNYSHNMTAKLHTEEFDTLFDELIQKYNLNNSGSVEFRLAMALGLGVADTVQKNLLPPSHEKETFATQPETFYSSTRAQPQAFTPSKRGRRPSQPVVQDFDLDINEDDVREVMRKMR